jgi:ACT domain-containing protein
LLKLLDEINIQAINIHKEVLVNGVQEIFLTLSTNNITMDFNDVVKDVRRLISIKEVMLLASE